MQQRPCISLVRTHRRTVLTDARLVMLWILVLVLQFLTAQSLFNATSFASRPKMRLLFVSLEFLGPVFSGNGQYSRSIVRALKNQGHTVCVLSGRGAAVPMDAQDAEAKAHAEAPHAVIDVPLTTWGRLDRRSGWLEFAAGATDASRVAAVAAFAPEAVLVVDYSGHPAWLALQAALADRGHTVTDAAASAASGIPCVYLNFRVFSTSVALFESKPVEIDAAVIAGSAVLQRRYGQLTPLSDAAFYQYMERSAMRHSAATVCLCRLDALQLAGMAAGTDPVTGAAVPAGVCEAEATAAEASSSSSSRILPDIWVLLPPLREDIAKLAESKFATAAAAPVPSWMDAASAPGGGAAAASFLTSVVRLSPEKGPHRFADLCAALASSTAPTNVSVPVPFFTGVSLRPLVCGSVGDKPYAAAVLDTLHTAVTPAVAPAAPLIISQFLGPADMATIFSRTRLNVHGALADAYGMTVVEAAALGAPSLVHVPSRLLPATSTTSVTVTATGAVSAAAAEHAIKPAHLFTAWHDKYAAAAAAEGLHGHTGAEGCLRLQPQPLVDHASRDSAAATNLGTALWELSHSLPPVGACDLLAPQPSNADESAVVAADLTLPAVELARVVGPLLAPGALAPLAELAQSRALGWREVHTGRALTDIVVAAAAK